MKKLWDISPPIHAASPVFPGDTAYNQQWVASISPGCPVNVSAITLSPHVGAHADAPLHYDPQGAAIGAVELQAFIGPCRVIHAIGCGPLVRPEHLAHALGDSPPGRSQGESAPAGDSDPRSGGAWGLNPLPPRVLVRVYECMPQDRFDTALPAFAPETVALLADRGVVLIGIDSASIDPAESKALESHQTIRRRGLRVLENLLLDDVPEGDYELIALPLKLTTADASPVRAVLREL
ncbi:cyclase family protein [Hydrogenophaga sp.]|uniref:cyclase family protein n=1 Tax=Hydrogenophaga sp. TaxID=1904254 RepID=UPI00286E24A7|nr:cyclase family protein [Hydrogenophaga sp.]